MPAEHDDSRADSNAWQPESGAMDDHASLTDQRSVASGYFFLVNKAAHTHSFLFFTSLNRRFPLRDEYLKQAQQKIQDPNILINLVSRRVKQLKYGMKPMVESLEKLEPEDIALREIIEGKIDYELWSPGDNN